MKLCEMIKAEIFNESTKGFKSKFPELYKVILKDGGADILNDAEVVKKVSTKAGDVYVVETPSQTNYFSIEHGWVGEEDGGLDHELFSPHQSEFKSNVKKAEITKIAEAQHYNTKVRELEENMGSRKIRLGLKESLQSVRNMLDENHPSPNPLTDKDIKLLSECETLIEQAIPRLKEVKETKKKKSISEVK